MKASFLIITVVPDCIGASQLEYCSLEALGLSPKGVRSSEAIQFETVETCRELMM